ncbi:cytochrome P450 2J2-like [Discoglossus pictus]
MLEATWAFLALLLSLLIIQYLKLLIASARLPPGPTPLPLLGNLWTVKFQLHHETLMKLAKIYGNVMTIWAGQAPIVVVNGYDAVRDCLIVYSDEFSQRPATPFFKVYADDKGIFVSNGRTWKEQRRIGMKIMRNLGLGTKGLEWKVQGEARRLVETFMSLNETAVDPRHYLVNTVSNVISAVNFGHHFSLEDELFHQLIEWADSVTNFYGTHWGQLYDAFPWLMHYLPGPQQKTFQHLQFLKDYMLHEIRLHQQNPAVEPQDVIDYYLKYISKKSNATDSTISEENLVQLLLDITLAGFETITTTLLWGLLYMVCNPDVQEKVQQELDAFLETSQTIQYENRKNLPYTNAVIHEISRCANVAPLGLPRQCKRDVTVQGYNIRKGTIVVTSLASAHRDHSHWVLPDIFSPSNFLDKDGNFKWNDAFVSFSAGHRLCLGEQLARIELFIFFTNLLQSFTFRLPPGVTEVNMKGVFGTTFAPHPYKICALPRYPSSD